MNPDHLTILEFLGWKRHASKWENPSKAVYGVEAPELSLDLTHEAETKFTDEEHGDFRDLLKSTALEPERDYVSAGVEDRSRAIAEVIELGKLAEEADRIAEAKDAEKAEESEPEQSEEEPVAVAA